GVRGGTEGDASADLGGGGGGGRGGLRDIRHIGRDGPGPVGSLLVAAARQLGEALLLDDRGDGRRAQRLAITGQGPADVVDGEVLLAEGDDLLPPPFLLAGRPALVGSGDEEVA